MSKLNGVIKLPLVLEHSHVKPDAKKASIVPGTESPLSFRELSQTEMDLRSKAEGSEMKGKITVGRN